MSLPKHPEEESSGKLIKAKGGKLLYTCNQSRVNALNILSYWKAEKQGQRKELIDNCWEQWIRDKRKQKGNVGCEKETQGD